MAEEKKDAAKDAAPATEQKKPAKDKKKGGLKSLLLKIVIGVVAFFVIIAVVVNTATSGAATQSDQFISYIQASDGDSAYELFSDAAKENTDQQEFADVISNIGPILSGEPKQTGRDISAGTDETTTATIEYTIDGSDGIKYDIRVLLVKVNDQWQVENFSSQASPDSVPTDTGS